MPLDEEQMMLHPLVAIGLMLVVIGAALIVLPLLTGYMPTLQKLERLPPVLVYVYRRDNFYLVTSPLLIVAGLTYFCYLALRVLKYIS